MLSVKGAAKVALTKERRVTLGKIIRALSLSEDSLFQVYGLAILGYCRAKG